MSKSTSQSQQPTAHADGLSFLKKNFKGILQNKDVSGTDSSQSQQPPSESIQSSSETGSNTPPPVQSNEQQQQPDIVVDPTYAVSADIQGIDTNPLELTRYWPRDPGGPILTSPFEFTGKRAPNAHVLWSANTTGFYFVHLNPKTKDPGWRHVVSQTMMAAECRRIGEAGFAKRQLERADSEAEPRRRQWADVAKIWEDEDVLIRDGTIGDSMRDAEIHMDALGSNREPFHPNSYPSPWPLVPFSTEPYKFQQIIPFRLLPEKLVVHDPFEVLSSTHLGSFDEGESNEWLSKPDKTYSYHLELLPDTIEAIEKDRQVTIKQRSENETVAIFESNDGFKSHRIRFSDSYSFQSNLSSGSNTIRITVPPSLPFPSSTPIAHLYLSPARSVGEGNHSYVYSAEWEVPRSIFVGWHICRRCVMIEAERIYLERKADPTMAESLGDIHVDNVPWYRPGVDSVERCRHHSQEEEPESNEASSFSCPPTSLVSVIAKLSIQHDTHLANESKNYQRFPDWMSEHWSGLTFALPIRNLARCGAIVPSWYGYYVPDKEEKGAEEGEGGRTKGYLSPIMLMEDCGVPIVPEELTRKDIYACCSLLTRFHYHGWLHNSFASRNILISYGDHTFNPYRREREVAEAKNLMAITKEHKIQPYYGLDNENEEDLMKDNQKRFRLIDFGRTQWVGDLMGDGMKETLGYSEDEMPKEKELGRTYAEELFCASPTFKERWEEKRESEKEQINQMVNWYFC